MHDSGQSEASLSTRKVNFMHHAAGPQIGNPVPTSSFHPTSHPQEPAAYDWPPGLLDSPDEKADEWNAESSAAATEHILQPKPSDASQLATAEYMHYSTQGQDQPISTHISAAGQFSSTPRPATQHRTYCQSQPCNVITEFHTEAVSQQAVCEQITSQPTVQCQQEHPHRLPWPTQVLKEFKNCPSPAIVSSAVLGDSSPSSQPSTNQPQKKLTRRTSSIATETMPEWLRVKMNNIDEAQLSQGSLQKEQDIHGPVSPTSTCEPVCPYQINVISFDVQACSTLHHKIDKQCASLFDIELPELPTGCTALNFS